MPFFVIEPADDLPGFIEIVTNRRDAESSASILSRPDYKGRARAFRVVEMVTLTVDDLRRAATSTSRATISISLDADWVDVVEHETARGKRVGKVPVARAGQEAEVAFWDLCCDAVESGEAQILECGSLYYHDGRPSGSRVNLIIRFLVPPFSSSSIHIEIAQPRMRTRVAA